MTLENFNPDAMNDPQELWNFWKLTNSVRPIATARKLFPTCPKGYVRATKNVGYYCANKATAIQCRLRGDVQSALTYERIADRIYNELPEYAKW